MTREEAQKLADRILAFREEIQELEQQGVAALPPDVAARIRGHHDQLLDRLAGRFDVDRTEAAKQLSLGMRIASLLGAIALSFAVFFFFYRFWGAFPTWAQVALLVAAPIAGVVGTEFAARRERTMYFAGIVALVAVVSFGLTLLMIGALFNMGASPDPYLAWGVFAGVLAYAFGLRLLLLVSAAGIVVFVSGRLTGWTGGFWGAFLQRPESLLVPGAALLAIPGLWRHRSLPSFPPLYRLMGLLAIFVPILILANAGWLSWLDLAPRTVEVLYQLIGFPAGGIGVWIGVRRGWKETTALSTGFLVLLLYVKFFDWWWSWMPKWLFFLILGAVAVGILLLLRRLQAAERRVAA